MTTGLERVLRPGRIGRLALPHRIVMGAMHLGWENRDDDGRALAAFYLARVAGGAGLMVTGGAAVSAAGADVPGFGVLDDAAFRDRLRRVAGEVGAAGGLLALQLFHAGRYARPAAGGPRPVAPSAVPSPISRLTPDALPAAGVARIVEDFARGAHHARDLGFSAVEIMGSEGYLIDQFLSPLTNRRDDEWGGDPQRRMRFGVAVVRAVRAAVGADFPVVMRMTGDDLLPGGTDRDTVAQYARALAAAGADALNVGVGWHESPVPTVQAVVPPGHWVPVASVVKAAVGGLPVLASNRINRLTQAEAILAGTTLDLVSMARPFLADPALVERSRAGRPVNICVACNQACIDRSLVGAVVSCMVNPLVGREADPGSGAAPAGTDPTASAELPASVDPPMPADPTGSAGLPMPAEPAIHVEPMPPEPAIHVEPVTRAGPVVRVGAVAGSRAVAVVGAGPAGLRAAHDLALAGHRVTVYEADREPGGQFRLACRVPGKADYAETIRFLTAELTRLGVVLHTGRPVAGADEDLLRRYDGVIVATGVVPRRPDLPGGALPHVRDYGTAFTDDALGRRVAVIGGGGIAVDLAHLASEPGAGPPRQVTILLRGDRLAPRMGRSTRWAVLAELRRRQVTVVTGVRGLRVDPDAVHLVDGTGAARSVPADTVVVAAGQLPADALVRTVRRVGVWHRVVGGARDTVGLDAVRAIAEGHAAALAFQRAARGTGRALRVGEPA
ncbi:FAD-dependent oxidoreductase [Micromonospora sp. RL09-050-HVF-A]|uniref:FAD-dependent oxidoreductase n=1 Tax=Micromonospora sp. RL09-050-HVF-A TaxID=1703433 RepID=UPI001C600700|nr:FAD-dependent oxidoreductase [Micromonospora sp. RL09-050-HVF-A]MBW4701617.1 FAD-dependent oxidoreductase [Micromonospora sp. RL09-050-HVF-A]